MPTSTLDDPTRLAALQRSGLLDSEPEEAFDRLTTMAAQLLHAPISTVTLVDSDRQFWKSQFGVADPWMTKRGTPLSHSFCQYVVTSGEPLIVSDSRENDLVRDNLAVAELGVIAYAGMPLRDPDGNALGSFCTIDTEPREWSAQDLEVLRYLADAATTEMHLRATVQQLQRTSRLKDQLIGLVSHELRTPISGILGTLRVLEMELAPGQDPQMLDMALESAERLLRLTNGLLHLEQIESGRMEMTPERVAVATLFNAARGSMAEGARTAGIELAFASADAFVHTHVHADCDRITQVFNNLIGNAIKFSPAGSTITVSATPRAGAVSFAVRDQGRGIPALKLERIFDRFSQVEADDKHVLGGAGLGLAVCRAIVEQHGGRIWAENLASGGAEFRFELPAAP